MLGQMSNFQAAQPEEAAHGEEKQAAHQRRPTVHSSQPNVFPQRTRSNRLALRRQPHHAAGSGASQQRKSQREKSQREEYTMSEKSLAGRKALVTGGARGMGAAIAEALTNAGASAMIGEILAALGQAT